MSAYDHYDYDFGKVWTDVHVSYREGYSTSVTNFHKHAFYEINLILTGNVRILLRDRTVDGTGCRIVLTRPGTPHYILCRPDTLYSRIYLVFTHEFAADYFPEWPSFSALFGDHGSILTPTPEQAEICKTIIQQIKREPTPFRKRLLTYYLLSRLADCADTQSSGSGSVPSFITDILTHIEQNFSSPLTAADLAHRFHVGRTTLMTAFKKYTGSTLGDYLTHCRLRHAVSLLRDGSTVESAAEACGFSDASGLIRSFRRVFGMTPREYLKNNDNLA